MLLLQDQPQLRVGAEPQHVSLHTAQLCGLTIAQSLVLQQQTSRETIRNPEISQNS